MAKTKGEGFAAKLRIEFRPGGDGEMKKDITAFMHSRHKPVFVFDGDKKPANNHIDPQDLPVNRQTAEHLDKVIKDQTGQDIKFQQNSGMTPEQKGSLRAEYLTYYKRRVFYLPFPSPEQVVWDDNVCQSLLTLILVTQEKTAPAIAAIIAQPDYKLKFNLLSKAIGHGALHPTQAHAMFVTRFVETKGPGFTAVSELLDRIIDAAEAKHA